MKPLNLVTSKMYQLKLREVEAKEKIARALAEISSCMCANEPKAIRIEKTS